MTKPPHVLRRQLRVVLPCPTHSRETDSGYDADDEAAPEDDSESAPRFLFVAAVAILPYSLFLFIILSSSPSSFSLL